MSGTKKLVIVESPAKAKTIAQYLGDGYEVLASVGHIRDLIEPKNLPPELKKGPLGKFSVDVENGFEPYYVVSDQKKKTVADLKRALKNADELYLATDEDREGEAIAWHLLEELKPKVPVHRMVFHEITKDAIQKARENTRDIDTSLVDAQETRRILDRLYGYEISPVLWRKVGPGLSAGRVQSAATRLVVDRERERLAFISASYWDLATVLAPESDASVSFDARLARLDGKRIGSGRDFDDRGQLKGDVTVLDEQGATALAQALRDPATTVRVSNLESKPYSRRPAAPFTTSTLQQEAARKLRFSARQTMSVAQSLYENGYITYMRTDSPALSQQALNAARSQAAALYGAETVPEKPRVYSGKNKNAQEAHEAIRPAGETFRTPDQLSGTLRGNDLRLYELIWKRTVASQMADAKGSTATVTLLANPAGDTAQAAEFTASGTVITFRGFLLAYEEGRDEERHGTRDEKDAKLPPLEVGQSLIVSEVEAKGHETSSPPRYTEASLVKALEELGIGRPSTYASIISTIVDRGYVTPRGTALVPNWIAFSVVRLLEDFFSDLVEYDFTAEMEGDLDKIAGGEEDRVDWLTRFYFGGGSHPGLRHVVDNLGEIDAKSINSVRITDDITLRIGKYGPYLEVAEEGQETPRRVNLPLELAPDELTPAKAQELIDAPVQTDRVLGSNPENGKIVVVKDGRFGPYVTETDPDAEPAADPATGEVLEATTAPAKRGAKKPAVVKPRTSSLFKSMDVASIDLATALRLLDLPRTVGEDPETGEPITAQNGRYGPYLKKGTDSRSLTSEDQIFEVELAEALEVFAQPKYGARRASSALKEFEADPVSGKPIRIRDGRFGPYVTDGETNVTIPKGQAIEEIDFEQAVQMLADKRAKGPAKKAPVKRAPAKKPAAKTAAAKTTTAKKTAAKTTAVKPASARATTRKAAPAADAPAATES
ncbi:MULTISPECIES: type I DNA topoisomerase [unclassified Rathayibacter]|uniref:type I DNA topoisomerase n=1 Tax=unclassified Rathayibacter TaxID=2609250 RepID=UPI00188B5E00|nr:MULTISPECIES: type I DNA topoisomerase [unclassified Rathayibacter]MBF4462859.1 type I DNA topoisomerase [Rathayibacter sp. VKM Ac-2879]MBF4504273.1 type I DNA topoisomerase [Rathayibacter sp. VKM Ac-2878]